MIKVAIHGARGKLGSKIVALIQASPELTFAGEVRDGTPACDVVIDVTSAEGVRALLPLLSTEKLIVGATGDLPLDELRKYATKNAVFIVPNFAHGIHVLYRLLETILSMTDESWNISIEETHHKDKKDSPSGTAKRIASKIDEQGRDASIESKREGVALGKHVITIQNAFEKIEISHEALSRDVYAQGCVRMISDIMKKEKGYFEF